MCEYINGTIIQEDFTMEKTIYNESNGLWYELQGDYYIPCLTVPAEEEKPIGIWGQRHLRHIKQERKALYTELLTSGRLNTYRLCKTTSRSCLASAAISSMSCRSKAASEIFFRYGVSLIASFMYFTASSP